MSELASYSIQAVFFALVAVVVVSRSKKTDLYQFALISIWLIGVIAIYAKYKDGQIFFYSNDQDFHRQVIEYYLPVEGFHISAIISLRYLLTIPVYLVSLLGFNAMLIIKFLQLSALLFVYQRSRKFLAAQLLSVKFWQLPLIAGPILVFMSLLSLRDVLLAYFALGFGSDIPNALGIKVTEAVASTDELDNLKVLAYPNPATDKVTVSVKGEGVANLNVTDISGKKVGTHVLNLINGSADVSIENLEAGLYIFNVVLENGKTSQFNVVKR